VILPDVNLLVHAYDTDSRRHDAARLWWEAAMNGTQAVGMSWIAILGFIRLTTHGQVMASPVPVEEACAHARAWLARPQVSVIEPGPRHAELLFSLLEAVGAGGNLTTDAHLAALAIEHQAELQSTDADFARFPGLRWRNPLV
jgi:uncharacterized protein